MSEQREAGGCMFILNSRACARGDDRVPRPCGKPVVEGVACEEHRGRVTFVDHTKAGP